MSREQRVALIQAIEQKRQSRVITYICSTRQGGSGQIGVDAVRAMYNHVRAIGHVPLIDLYLYSHGGQVEAPWRLVNMLREYCDRLAVLVPHYAHSATTLIALGADELILGKKAELGPIDPALSRIKKNGGTVEQEDIRVEDVMSYIDFLKVKVGITDQAALGVHVGLLAQNLTPWVVGKIHRTHSHIRMVAQRLLGSHVEPMAPEVVQTIVSALAEETRSHGHAISRFEADALGLPVMQPDEELDDIMWQLLEHYEQLGDMTRPVDAETLIGANDTFDLPMTHAWIETVESTRAFRGTLRLTRARNTPPRYELKLNFGINLNLQVPPGTAPPELVAAIQAQVQSQLQQQLQPQLQPQLQNMAQVVENQVRAQSPPGDVTGRILDGYWRDITAEPN